MPAFAGMTILMRTFWGLFVPGLCGRFAHRTRRRFGSRLVGQHLDVAGDLPAILHLQAAAAGGAQHLAGGAHEQEPRAVSVPSIVPAISTSSTSISPLKTPPGEMASSVAWIMVASIVPSTTRRSASWTVPWRLIPRPTTRVRRSDGSRATGRIGGRRGAGADRRNGLRGGRGGEWLPGHDLHLLRLGGTEGRHAQAVVDRPARGAGVNLFLVGNRQAGGQGGARFGRLRVVRLATFEHRRPRSAGGNRKSWRRSGVTRSVRREQPGRARLSTTICMGHQHLVEHVHHGGGSDHRNEQVEHGNGAGKCQDAALRQDGGACAAIQRLGRGARHSAHRHRGEQASPDGVAADDPGEDEADARQDQRGDQRQDVEQQDPCGDADGVPDLGGDRGAARRRQRRVVAALDRGGDAIDVERADDGGDRQEQP